MALKLLVLLTIVFSSSIFAFELQIVQGVSKTGQTFITRSGKKDGVFLGKKATFTADNISIIAKAITVTREFTQWEIENNFSEIPFKKGQVVTYYDTTEYLWALTPEKIKTKFIKSNLYEPRKSVGIHTSFFRGISESVSGVDGQSDSRGGIQVEAMFEKEFNINFALAGGIRYTNETINVSEASLTSQRFLGVFEARYYFDALRNFYGARPSFALGAGFGQSQTDADGLSSSGTVKVLPITKFGLSLPMSKTTEFTFEAAFESLEITEEFEDNTEQITNVDNFKTGISVKRYFN